MKDEPRPDPPRPGFGDPDPQLDRALRAAFGPTDDTATIDAGRGASSLEATLGFHSRILLRDEDDAAVQIVDPRSDEVPARTPRYQVLGEIARGGVGVVFKGRDADLGRDVAMKVLRSDHAQNRAMVQRFVEEAQISGQLQHPGILPVYELGVQADRRPFFTMKLVKGRTLAALLRDRPDPAEDRPRFLRIFEDVCQTTAYAHSRGVVHRDLKPSNIMVGAFGEVQVVDWGLAKVLAQGGLADEPRTTAPAVEESTIQTVRSEQPGSQSIAGSVMGTPAYMAPEQARGEIARVDERADVFALGGILCEILTGDPPFGATATPDPLADAASADLGGALARLDACGADEELLALARVCLAPAPTERPRDARAVTAAITAYLASLEDRAREADLAAAEARAAATHERRSRRLVMSLAASIILALVAGGAVVMWAQTDRANRRSAATERVNGALATASLRLGEAKVAPIGDQSSWSAVRSAGNHVRALLETESAEVSVRRRAEQFLAELARADRDRRLVETIEDVVIMGATHSDVDSWLWMEERLRETFLDHGIDLRGQTHDEVAAVIRDSDLTRQLSDGLELWIATGFGIGGSPRSPYTIEELLGWVQVLFAADPDPLRTKLRQQLYAETPDRAALLALAASVSFDAVHPRTLSFLASTFSRLDDWRTVLSIYERTVLVHPGDFMLNFDYAWHLALAQRWEEATRYYVRCLGIRPGSAGVWRSLGVALREVGDLPGSLAALDQSLVHQPDHVHTHIDRGYTLHLMGESRRAIDLFEGILADRPELPLAHAYLGLALQVEGRLDEALAALLEARRLAPAPGMWWSQPIDEWIESCRKAIDDAGASSG